MMTIRRATTLVATALIVLAIVGAPGADSAERRAGTGFAVRMVKLGGEPADPVTLAHVRFCRKLGFNTLWVYGHQAGAWTKGQAPQGPLLDPDFLRLARWCRRHRMDIWVSINPVDETRERFIFTDPDGERRLIEFATLLRKQAGVRRIVLSFDDQPTTLRELSDIFRYGASAAPAHLDLAQRVAAGLPRDVAFWLCASVYCDAHLGDRPGPYGKAFLTGLPALPSSVGIVWTGPKVLSPTITRADVEATRARLGGRQILLYDNFPVEDDDEDDAMALILGGLRDRDAGIRDVVAAYLACPARSLAGSRLSLMTIAEYLLDPAGYAPAAATARAIVRLAGPDDPEAVRALETQQLEWGGFIEGRNYWPRDLMNPELAADRLSDPAFVSSFTWTVERYPSRMAELERLADTPFRDELLRVMRRRLAIARTMPLTVEYLARVRAGRADAAEMLARIEVERRSWDGRPDTRRVLDRFLGAAAVPLGEVAR